MTEWKLVPVEPTDAMRAAAEIAYMDMPEDGGSDGMEGTIYAAMLAASPRITPPRRGGDGSRKTARNRKKGLAVLRPRI